jgi:hypothetical protein
VIIVAGVKLFRRTLYHSTQTIRQILGSQLMARQSSQWAL